MIHYFAQRYPITASVLWRGFFVSQHPHLHPPFSPLSTLTSTSTIRQGSNRINCPTRCCHEYRRCLAPVALCYCWQKNVAPTIPVVEYHPQCTVDGCGGVKWPPHKKWDPDSPDQNGELPTGHMNAGKKNLFIWPIKKTNNKKHTIYLSRQVAQIASHKLPLTTYSYRHRNVP